MKKSVKINDFFLFTIAKLYEFYANFPPHLILPNFYVFRSFAFSKTFPNKFGVGSGGEKFGYRWPGPFPLCCKDLCC